MSTVPQTSLSILQLLLFVKAPPPAFSPYSDLISEVCGSLLCIWSCRELFGDLNLSCLGLTPRGSAPEVSNSLVILMNSPW